MEITSARFLMRPLTVRDVSLRYCEWLSDSVTSQFIEMASSTCAAAELEKYVSERVGRPDVLFLGIFLRETGQHIGNIKYEPINLSEKYAVMGIMIGEPLWRGKGVGPEVISRTANWLKTEMELQEIVLGVDIENVPGIRAYENCGFKIATTSRVKVDPNKAITMVLNLMTV